MSTPIFVISFFPSLRAKLSRKLIPFRSEMSFSSKIFLIDLLAASAYRTHTHWSCHLGISTRSAHIYHNFLIYPSFERYPPSQHPWHTPPSYRTLRTRQSRSKDWNMFSSFCTWGFHCSILASYWSLCATLDYISNPVFFCAWAGSSSTSLADCDTNHYRGFVAFVAHWSGLGPYKCNEIIILLIPYDLPSTTLQLWERYKVITKEMDSTTSTTCHFRYSIHSGPSYHTETLGSNKVVLCSDSGYEQIQVVQIYMESIIS